MISCSFTKDGIYSADVILVPLEDGDRAEALISMDKKVLVIDLNPLSRSAQAGTVTVVDNISRAIKVIIKHVKEQKEASDIQDLNRAVNEFDNKENLVQMTNLLKAENYKNYI